MKNITIQIPDNELANGFLKEFSKEQRLKHQHYIMKLKKVCLYRTVGLALVEPADDKVIFKSDK